MGFPHNVVASTISGRNGSSLEHGPPYVLGVNGSDVSINVFVLEPTSTVPAPAGVRLRG